MNGDERNPFWIKLHSRPIQKTGELLLSNNIEVNLFDFSSVVFQPLIPLVKILDISGIYSISSLEGLPYLPHLHIFNASDTEISTFVNFHAIRNAARVSFRNTPISVLPYYRLSLLLICGKGLISIDGQTISPNLLTKYTQYPKITAKLINSGWNLEYPCPDIETLNEKYDTLNGNQELSETNVLSNCNSTNSQDDISEMYIENFGAVRDEYHKRQQMIFWHSEKFFQPSTKQSIQAELALLIKDLFLEHNQCLDENNIKGILNSVEMLCQKASLKRKISNSFGK